MDKKIQNMLSPIQIVVLSFLLIITLGGILLSLPISQTGKITVPLIDAFFTSTSAVCVTGLVTLVTATTWSFFGKIVILCLIQIGGLSLITMLTFLMVSIGKKISLKSRLAIQTALNKDSPGGAVRTALWIIKGTLIVELIASLLLFIIFLLEGIVWHKALFWGIFHSISAFCNAGFDIIGETSLMPYAGNFGINIIIMTLIVIGGIGFTVWDDVLAEIRFLFLKRKRQQRNFSLHTKLALLFTAVLLVWGTLFFLIAEYNNPKTLGGLPFAQKLLASSFQSVATRTAGYFTLAQDGMKETSKLFCSILMLTGGSPGGTAGGIKTVTLAIVLCSVRSILKGCSKIVAFERTISIVTLQKALTVFVLMLSLLFVGTTILSVSEQDSAFPHGISDLIFEVSSALGTVGLTTGITPFLSNIGKLVLMLCMFIGRIGPVTLIISLSRPPRAEDEALGYPHEDVIIG